MEKEPESLVTSSIARAIYIVAGPSMLHMLLATSYHLVDTIWLGMLGPYALAAVASSSFLLWLIIDLCEISAVGINSLAARAFGGNDMKRLYEVACCGIRFSAFLGFLLMATSIYFAPAVLKWMNLESEVIEGGKSYLTIIMIGLPVYCIMTSQFAVFRGAGDTRTPFFILLGSVAMNLALTPVLMFGLFGFPRWGIIGGATASVISHIFGAASGFVMLRRKKLISLKKPEKSHSQSSCPKTVRQIAKIGFPVSLNGVAFGIVYIFVTKIAAPFGTSPIAALGIGHRVETLIYCVCLGFSIAATTLVGQNLGAKNPQRASQSAWKIAFYAFTFSLSVATLMWIYSHEIAAIFTRDPDVIDATGKYIRIIAYSEAFMALEIVLTGVFSGIGNTLPATIVGLPLNFLRIPLAWGMSQIWGIEGVWWAISLSSILKGISLYVWLKIKESRGTAFAVAS